MCLSGNSRIQSRICVDVPKSSICPGVPRRLVQRAQECTFSFEGPPRGAPVSGWRYHLRGGQDRRVQVLINDEDEAQIIRVDQPTVGKIAIE